jgi:hypothetical protein
MVSHAGRWARYDVSPDAVERHRQHVPISLTRAREAREAAAADTLLALVNARLDKAERHVQLAEGLIGRAVGAEDLRAAIAGVQAATTANREARECLTLLAKLRGELDERPTINVTVSAEWVEIRSAPMETLPPFPEACAAVVARLASLEAA